MHVNIKCPGVLVSASEDEAMSIWTEVADGSQGIDLHSSWIHPSNFTKSLHYGKLQSDGSIYDYQEAHQSK